MAAAAASTSTNNNNNGGGNFRPSGGKPGWLLYAQSMPNKVPEPNFDAFLAKVKALNDEKEKLWDKLNLLGFQRKKTDGAEDEAARRKKEDEADPAKAAYRREQEALRNKVQGLREKQQSEREKASAKRQELQRLRDERRAMERALDDLTREVGLFRNASEVEDAMDRLLYKMETGVGDLKAEKLCSKRLGQLENVKTLLEKMGPLLDAIQDAEDNERSLADENKVIGKQLATINDEIEETLNEKKAKGQAKEADGANEKALRDARNAEKTKLFDRIRAIGDQVKTIRDDFDQSKKQWNEFKELAQKEYQKEQERKRAEYLKKKQEIEDRKKAERKQRRASKKLNPHEAEIGICDALARVLKDRAESAEQDRVKAERAKKLAEFDAAKAAPQGLLLKKEDEDWLFIDRSNKKAGGKKTTTSTAAAAAAPAAKKSSNSNSNNSTAEVSFKDRLLHLPGDRVQQFARVQVDAPATFGEIEKTLVALAAQKKLYESKKKSLDEVTTDESTDEEAPAQDEEAAAAAAAVAAVIAVEESQKKN